MNIFLSLQLLNDSNNYSYITTFKGRLFFENGGYLEEQKSLDEEKSLVRNLMIQGEKNARYLNYLTLILAIGTIALVFVTCLEKFHLLTSIVLWTSLYLFLLGCSAGILLTFLLLVLRKSSK